MAMRAVASSHVSRGATEKLQSHEVGGPPAAAGGQASVSADGLTDDNDEVPHPAMMLFRSQSSRQMEISVSSWLMGKTSNSTIVTEEGVARGKTN